jgi:hypothetical protein
MYRLLLVLLMLMVSGCCWPSKRGDARMVSCDSIIKRPGDESLSVSLPKVSLSKPAVYDWKVRRLPPSDYSYTLNLPLPRGEQKFESGLSDQHRVPTWSDAVVTIKFFSLDGMLMSEKAYQLGETIKGHSWPTDGVWQMSLAELTGMATATDYNIQLTVVIPSATPQDTAQICGHTIYNPHAYRLIQRRTLEN